MAKILVVDDDPAVREVIQAALESEGAHAVDAAADGFEALERLKKSAYDLAILDWNMPRLSGLEVLQVVRASPAMKAMKVIMCTSAGSIGEVDKAFAAGADDYVVKPVDLDRLFKKVAKYCPS